MSDKLTPPFLNLPKETLGNILSFIPPHERLSLQNVCQYFTTKLREWAPHPAALTITKSIKYVKHYTSYPKIFLNFVPHIKKDADYFQFVLIHKPTTDTKNSKNNQTKKAPSPSPWRQHDITKFSYEKNELVLSLHLQPNFCGNHAYFRLISVNNFSITREDCEHYIQPATVEYYCWNGEAKIKMYDGSFKEVQRVCIGDVLMSGTGRPTTVKRIKETQIFGNYKMVQLGDFWITRGHPIYVNNEWYRPDEIYPITEVFIDTLYNFYAEPEHFLVVGEEEQFTCSSLGGYCPRLAEIDPYSDILYGRGYGSKQAESYRWLLYLKERIPDSEVVPKVPEEYIDLFPGREELVVQ